MQSIKSFYKVELNSFLPNYAKGLVLSLILLTLTACGSGSNNAASTPQELAIEKIADYAQDGVVEPTLQDYLDAGITGVDSSNLTDVNTVVEQLTNVDVDTEAEIQALADSLGIALLEAPILENALAQIYNENEAITLLNFSNIGGGTLTSCTADTLPIGLVVATSTDSSTCEITGKPTTIQLATTHTITASNATGSDTATVSIEVKAIVIPLALPALENATAQSYTKDSPITPIVFTNSGGGELTNCTISPVLPIGLSITVSTDTNTCEISGAPTEVQAVTVHTIKATNVTGNDTASVSVVVNETGLPVSAAVPTLTYNTIKIFQFNWLDVGDATYYKLMENPGGAAGFSQIGSDFAQGVHSFSHIVPLYARMNAQYILQSCNAVGCVDSITLNVVDNLVESIGYLKASNTDRNDGFGFSTSISGDGATLAVGVLSEDSATSGVNTIPNEAATDSGAVYIFIRNGISWQQEAYIKASNTGAGDAFGGSVELSSDGNTLVVAATEEDSGTSGINTTANEAAANAGAVYVFTRDSSNWQQEAYIKAGNAGLGDRFGASVSLSSNGNTLAVGARSEDSNTTGTNSTPNDFTTDSGAAYVFTRSGNTWVQRDYIKGSNTDFEDSFGSSISLNADGSVLAVGANSEDRNVTGVNGIPVVNSTRMANSGAVYVFVKTISSWTQRAYIKAGQINVGDTFGSSVSLSADGAVLAIGAGGEDSSTTGVNTTPDELAQSSGAVYIFSDNGSDWSQQTYLKASNAGAFDFFGNSLSLSADGNTLAVGATGEDGSTNGINSAPDEIAPGAGAAYIFSRSGSTWIEQAYIKASNTEAGDLFGQEVSLSDDGNTLAVGAYSEDSATSGVNSIPDDNSSGAGAVYLY